MKKMAWISTVIVCGVGLAQTANSSKETKFGTAAGATIGYGAGGSTVGVNVQTQDLTTADDATIGDDCAVLGDLAVTGTLELTTLDINGVGIIDSAGNSFLNNGTFDGTLTVAQASLFNVIQVKSIDLLRDPQTDDGAWAVDVTDNAMFFTGTITQATTIAAPDATTTNKMILFRVKQDGTGGRTLSWNAIYRFNGFTGTASTAASAVDHWVFIYNTTDSKWDCVSASKPNLDLSGNLAAAGELTVGGGYGGSGVTLTTTGDVGADGNVIADGDLSAGDDLTVADSAQIAGNAYVVGSLQVAGKTISTAALDVIDEMTTSNMRTAMGVAIGTNVQSYDADLLALAGLTSAANQVPRFSGSGTAGLITIVDGSWTATVSGTVNVDSSTVYSSPYLRVASSVQGTVSLDVDTTAAASTTTTIELSLPVGSNFSTSVQLGGSGVIGTSPQIPLEVLASAANDTMFITWKSNATTNARVRIVFFYTVN